MRIAALLLMVPLAAPAAEPPAPSATTPAATTPAATTPAATTPAATTPAAAQVAAPAPAPAAAAPAAAAPTAAAVSPETLKKAMKLGLRPRQRKGATMYCKDFADIGTRIPTEHCYAAESLDAVTDQMTEAQEMMRRAGACPNAACGGN